MKYSITKRLADLYGLLIVCFLPLLITFAVRSVTGSVAYFAILKIVFIGAYLAVLLSPKIFSWIESKTPSLKPYVVRFSIAAFLLLMIAFFDASPADGVLYYAFLLSLALGIIFIGVAKIGAIIGR